MDVRKNNIELIIKVFPKINLFLALTIERRTEDYTYLRYSDGVRCKWDAGMAVYLTLDQTYMKQVTGLCGTYTNKKDGNIDIINSSFSNIKLL